MEKENNLALAPPNGLLTSTTSIISSVLDKSQPLPVVASRINDVAISKPGGGTQLSKLKKELGELHTKRIIALLVIDLSESFNVKNELSDNQIKTIVDMIMAERWHLKIEQIARAFHLQKTGYLVKIYDRIDIELILKILDEYEQKITLPENNSDALYHKEFIDERKSSTGTKAATELMREAMNKYLIEGNGNETTTG